VAVWTVRGFVLAEEVERGFAEEVDTVRGFEVATGFAVKVITPEVVTWLYAM
jgi:hypothetical protein